MPPRNRNDLPDLLGAMPVKALVAHCICKTLKIHFIESINIVKVTAEVLQSPACSYSYICLRNLDKEMQGHADA